MVGQRLQKFLASAGVASRRRCEQLIIDGAVRVNRKVVDTLPVFVEPDVDVITVNGKVVRSARKVYFLLNKPKGVICTNSDPQGRQKAIDLVPSKQRIFCVGRLDADTTGLIILTNDNELTNKLTHPRYKISREYVAVVRGRIEAGQIEKLKKGVWLAEGRTGRASVKILRRSAAEAALEVTVTQGLNRQIRRMLAKVGLKVKSLKRTRIGRIDARGIGIGKYRPLTKAEVVYLNKTAVNR